MSLLSKLFAKKDSNARKLNTAMNTEKGTQPEVYVNRGKIFAHKKSIEAALSNKKDNKKLSMLRITLKRFFCGV